MSHKPKGKSWDGFENVVVIFCQFVFTREIQMIKYEEFRK